MPRPSGALNQIVPSTWVDNGDGDDGGKNIIVNNNDGE